MPYIAEPNIQDEPIIHDLHEWLTKHQASLAGSPVFDQALEIYETNRMDTLEQLKVYRGGRS